MVTNWDIWKINTGDSILSVDIGGSRVKATLLNQAGELLRDYRKVDTPSPATPENVIGGYQNAGKGFAGYEKVSVGFPGYVREGVIQTAPNLGTDLWRNVDLQQMLTRPCKNRYGSSMTLICSVWA